MHILWNHISTVQQTRRHVFTSLWVAFDHLVVLLKAGHGNFLNRVLLVLGFGGRNDWRVGDEWEVNTRVRNQVGLEFVQVDIQGTIETKRGGDRRYNYDGLISTPFVWRG
jgi:hypothetical protein